MGLPPYTKVSDGRKYQRQEIYYPGAGAGMRLLGRDAVVNALAKAGVELGENGTGREE